MRAKATVLAAAVVAMTLIGSNAGAQIRVPECARLSGEQKKLADQLLSSQYPYDCCDRPISECLRQKPVCALAVRLARNICRRVAEGQPREKIVRALSKRADFFLSEKKAAIALDGVPVLGEKSAPVQVVEYACARCPFCAKITPELHRAITSGPLKGKARLYLKVFPIRSHEFSKEAGMGFLAAAELGKFWEFVLYSYAHFDYFCPLKQADWAAEVGMVKQDFERLVSDERLRARLVENVKEGLRNGVDATPTFFIDGRKFSGDLTAAELIDVVEEEYDNLRGVKYVKDGH